MRSVSGQWDTGKSADCDSCCPGGANEEFSAGRRQFFGSRILMPIVVIHPASAVRRRPN